MRYTLLLALILEMAFAKLNKYTERLNLTSRSNYHGYYNPDDYSGYSAGGYGYIPESYSTVTDQDGDLDPTQTFVIVAFMGILACGVLVCCCCSGKPSAKGLGYSDDARIEHDSDWG